MQAPTTSSPPTGATRTSAVGPAKELPTVSKETTRTALKLSTPSLTYGHEQVEHLAVSVSSEFGATPSGTVMVTRSTMTLCVITLVSGKGSCTLSAERFGAGGYDIVATYGGSSNLGTSASTKAPLTVAEEASFTSLKLSAAKVTYGHEQVEHLVVTVSSEFGGTPNGTVKVSSSSTTLCVITLSSGHGSCTLTAEKLGAGTHGLVATFSGNPDIRSSASGKGTLKISKATSKTTFKLSTSKVTYGDEQVELLSVTVTSEFAGVSPTGTVTLKGSSTTVCVIRLSSGTGSCRLSAKELAVGLYDVVATYGGSPNLGASASKSETLTVNLAEG